jgi:phosphoribosyl 1,2-cyclic phosphodiesterase
MEVVVLGSGSAGNSTLVCGGGARVLVDAGLSCKQLEMRLASANVDPGTLDAILLTHEHIDHTSGLKVFLKRWKIPLYCNSATAGALAGKHPGASVRLFETGSSFVVNDLHIRSFSVPHDASDPVGFRIEEGESAFGVLTDLGYATRLVLEAMREVRALLIETNYDSELLQRTPNARGL